MVETAVSLERHVAFGSLSSFKCCALHGHADAVALCLCRGRGVEAAALHGNGATGTGFTCKRGIGVVQRHIPVAVGH